MATQLICYLIHKIWIKLFIWKEGKWNLLLFFSIFLYKLRFEERLFLDKHLEGTVYKKQFLKQKNGSPSDILPFPITTQSPWLRPLLLSLFLTKQPSQLLYCKFKVFFLFSLLCLWEISFLLFAGILNILKIILK